MNKENITLQTHTVTVTNLQSEIPWQFVALPPMLSVTHIMPVLVLLSVVGVGIQQCMIRNQKSRMDADVQLTINGFRPHFSWWYLKRFKSYCVDNWTHPQTDTTEKNPHRYAIAAQEATMCRYES